MSRTDSLKNSAAANASTTLANNDRTSVAHGNAAALHRIAADSHKLAGDDELSKHHNKMALDHETGAYTIRQAEGVKVGSPTASTTSGVDNIALVTESTRAKTATVADSMKAGSGYGACPKCGAVDNAKTMMGADKSEITCGGCGASSKADSWMVPAASAKAAAVVGDLNAGGPGSGPKPGEGRLSADEQRKNDYAEKAKVAESFSDYAPKSSKEADAVEADPKADMWKKSGAHEVAFGMHSSAAIHHQEAAQKAFAIGDEAKEKYHNDRADQEKAIGQTHWNKTIWSKPISEWPKNWKAHKAAAASDIQGLKASNAVQLLSLKAAARMEKNASLQASVVNGGFTLNNLQEQVNQKVLDMNIPILTEKGTGTSYCGSIWVCDIVAPPHEAGEVWKAVVQGADGCLYSQEFSIGNGTVTLVGDPSKVEKNTEYDYVTQMVDAANSEITQSLKASKTMNSKSLKASKAAAEACSLKASERMEKNTVLTAKVAALKASVAGGGYSMNDLQSNVREMVQSLPVLNTPSNAGDKCCGCWVCDLVCPASDDDNWSAIVNGADGKLYSVDFDVDDSGDVSIDGDPSEVERSTDYEYVNDILMLSDAAAQNGLAAGGPGSGPRSGGGTGASDAQETRGRAHLVSHVHDAAAIAKYGGGHYIASTRDGLNGTMHHVDGEDQNTVKDAASYVGDRVKDNNAANKNKAEAELKPNPELHERLTKLEGKLRERFGFGDAAISKNYGEPVKIGGKDYMTWHSEHSTAPAKAAAATVAAAIEAGTSSLRKSAIADMATEAADQATVMASDDPSQVTHDLAAAAHENAYTANKDAYDNIIKAGATDLDEQHHIDMMQMHSDKAAEHKDSATAMAARATVPAEAIQAFNSSLTDAILSARSHGDSLEAGDYPGHPFRGNQFGEGQSGGMAGKASAKAHEATKSAATAPEHKAAAALHRTAARMQAKKGNADTAQYHQMMAQYHDSAATDASASKADKGDAMMKSKMALAKTDKAIKSDKPADHAEAASAHTQAATANKESGNMDKAAKHTSMAEHHREMGMGRIPSSLGHKKKKEDDKKKAHKASATGAAGIEAGGPGSGRKPSDIYFDKMKHARELTIAANNASAHAEHTGDIEDRKAAIEPLTKASAAQRKAAEAAHTAGMPGMEEAHRAAALSNDRLRDRHWQFIEEAKGKTRGTAAAEAGSESGLEAGGAAQTKTFEAARDDAMAAGDKAKEASDKAMESKTKDDHDDASDAHALASTEHKVAAIRASADGNPVAQAFHQTMSENHKAMAETHDKAAEQMAAPLDDPDEVKDASKKKNMPAKKPAKAAAAGTEAGIEAGGPGSGPKPGERGTFAMSKPEMDANSRAADATTKAEQAKTAADKSDEWSDHLKAMQLHHAASMAHINAANLARGNPDKNISKVGVSYHHAQADRHEQLAAAIFKSHIKTVKAADSAPQPAAVTAAATAQVPTDEPSTNPAAMTMVADDATAKANAASTDADAGNDSDMHDKASKMHGKAYAAHMAAYAAHTKDGSDDTLLQKHMQAMADHKDEMNDHDAKAEELDACMMSRAAKIKACHDELAASGKNPSLSDVVTEFNAKNSANISNDDVASALTAQDSDDDESEAYTEGFNADDDAENPYGDGTEESDEWQAGYDAGHGNEARAAGPISELNWNMALTASANVALEAWNAESNFKTSAPAIEDGIMMFMPGGTHTITPSQGGRPVTVTLTINAESADAMEAQRKALTAKGKKPFFSIQHSSEIAAFWVSEFFWDKRIDATGSLVDGVWAKGQWTSAGKEAVEGKNFRTFSPTFFVNYVKNDPSDPSLVVCNVDARANVGALENDAAFQAMSPLWAKNSASTSITLNKSAVRDCLNELTAKGENPDMDALRSAVFSSRNIHLTEDEMVETLGS